MKRGQVSTEVLILIGMMLFLMLPLLLYAGGRAGVAREDLAVQKAEFAAHRLAMLADSVGYLGGAAAIVDEIEVPPYVKSVSISPDGHDIIFDLDSTAGTKQIVKSSAFVISSNDLDRIKKEGTYFVEVTVAGPLTGAQVQMNLK